MKTKNASAIASLLVYTQALLVVTAVAAVVMRLPADEPQTATAGNAVVASVAVETVAQ